MADCLQVITTTETREDARTIARETVRARAAACAQIVGPVTSTFWWKGRVEEGEEFLCIMKTTSKAYDFLEKTIRTLHSYEVPEIIAVPIQAGGRDYLQWLEEEIQASS